MIKNLSFIVIARNEEFAVDKCLGSIEKMPLEDCEVICVDSESTDNTLEVMKSYKDRIENMSVFRCSGKVNSAIGRNVGIKNATKEFVFFVDGDVELNSEFIKEGIEYLESGEAQALTGNLSDILYDDTYSKVVGENSNRRKIAKKSYILRTGGIFLTTKKMLDKIGLFDERLYRNQDYDYTLRISQNGNLLEIPFYMGIHHTRCFKTRYWQFFKKLYPMCYGIMLRKNIRNPHLFFKILSKNGAVCVGSAVYFATLFAFLAAFVLDFSLLFVLLFFCVLLILDIMSGLIRKKNIPERFVSHYLYTPLTWAGFFRGKKIKGATKVEMVL